MRPLRRSRGAGPRMTWSEQGGSVTEAFDEWLLVDQNIRTYKRLPAAFAETGFDSLWDKLSTAPGDPDRPDLPDLLHNEIDGLWPEDYSWMRLAGILKDPVRGQIRLGASGCGEMFTRRRVDPGMQARAGVLPSRGSTSPVAAGVPAGVGRGGARIPARRAAGQRRRRPRRASSRRAGSPPIRGARFGAGCLAASAWSVMLSSRSAPGMLSRIAAVLASS
jgi:hypothetical protein